MPWSVLSWHGRTGVLSEAEEDLHRAAPGSHRVTSGLYSDAAVPVNPSTHCVCGSSRNDSLQSGTVRCMKHKRLSKDLRYLISHSNHPMRQTSTKLTVARLIVAVAGILCVSDVISRSARAQADATENAQRKSRADDLERFRPKVKLGKVAVIALGHRPPLPREKAERIKTCIAALASIDYEYFGPSWIWSGWTFLPLPGRRESRAQHLTDDGLKASKALQTLVEIGPDALPFLLAALSDKTATKLTIVHEAYLREAPRPRRPQDGRSWPWLPFDRGGDGCRHSSRSRQWRLRR